MKVEHSKDIMAQAFSRFNFGYSTKNIPIPSRKEYKLQLIQSLEKFVHNIRWRVWHHLNPGQTSDKETYGFRSLGASPKLQDLIELEVGLKRLIQNVKFRDYSNEFQEKLKKDRNTINDEPKVFIKADKTSNYYKAQKKTYEDLVTKEVHKCYKKATQNDLNQVVMKHQDIVENLELSDRIPKTAEAEAQINLKDHKPGFEDDPQVRLINPSKPFVGRISKIKLAKIIDIIKKKTSIIQWKNTDSVIDWFEQIPDKSTYTFISCDIKEFYPSIVEPLLKETINWAASITHISDEDKELFISAKASFLFYYNAVWKKKGGKLFDVTMGSYDGAETCDLVVLFLLSKCQDLGITIGAYRDDWLGISNLNGRQTELRKKRLAEILKKYGLKIEVIPNAKVVNFLDVTLNLNTGVFRPFQKENNEIFYIHKDSNHPPPILKNAPKNINHRLSSRSSNEEVFEEAAVPYQAALDASGFNHKLKFDPNARNKPGGKKRTRKRNITWFNPPWSSNVATNIGKDFLNLITVLFPKNHHLHKVINRNTVKVSYRCMPNMKRIISKHNRKVLKPQEDQVGYTCNCRNPVECPLPGQCTINKVMYKGTVTYTPLNDDGTPMDQEATETYTGITANTFKKRHGNHTSNFRHEDQSTATMLSSFIWTLKRKNIPYKLEWSVLGQAEPYNQVTGICRLCLVEKHEILFNPRNASLNQRSEFFTHCRHKRTILLSGNNGPA